MTTVTYTRHLKTKDVTVVKDTLTVAEARAMLASREPTDGRCRINPSLTERQAWEIFQGALDGKPDDELVHWLVAKNIVRVVGRSRRAKFLTEIAR